MFSIITTTSNTKFSFFFLLFDTKFFPLHFHLLFCYCIQTDKQSCFHCRCTCTTGRHQLPLHTNHLPVIAPIQTNLTGEFLCTVVHQTFLFHNSWYLGFFRLIFTVINYSKILKLSIFNNLLHRLNRRILTIELEIATGLQKLIFKNINNSLLVINGKKIGSCLVFFYSHYHNYHNSCAIF